jgi:hypothetical protein
MEGTMTADLMQILTHSLGLDRDRGRLVPWRDHFAAESGSDDYARCEKLTGMGMMKKGRSLGYGDYFHVTEAGKTAGVESMATPK